MSKLRLLLLLVVTPWVAFSHPHSIFLVDDKGKMFEVEKKRSSFVLTPLRVGDQAHTVFNEAKFYTHATTWVAPLEWSTFEVGNERIHFVHALCPVEYRRWSMGSQAVVDDFGTTYVLAESEAEKAQKVGYFNSYGEAEGQFFIDKPKVKYLFPSPNKVGVLLYYNDHTIQEVGARYKANQVITFQSTDSFLNSGSYRIYSVTYGPISRREDAIILLAKNRFNFVLGILNQDHKVQWYPIESKKAVNLGLATELVSTYRPRATQTLYDVVLRNEDPTARSVHCARRMMEEML